MTTNFTKQGLPRPADDVWRSYVEEWDRSLRAANRPHTTCYNYQLAVTQLPAFLEKMDMPADDDSDAAQDPTDVGRKHVEWFIAWMIDTRSASTALKKYKGIQQFFNYLVECEEIDRHPMDKLSQPDTPTKLVPILSDEEIARLLEACRGKTYSQRRDTAIIRLFLDTGARLTEVASLQLDNVDLKRDGTSFAGKATGSGSSRSVNAPGKPSAATCAPALSTRQRTSPTCSWPNAGASRSSRTASRSCCAAAAKPLASQHARPPATPHAVSCVATRAG